jgi:hypothetical protein
MDGGLGAGEILVKTLKIPLRFLLGNRSHHASKGVGGKPIGHFYRA